MAAEIVHHHDIAGPQGWNEELLDPGEEAFAVDWPIEQAGGDDAVAAQARDEGECLARPVRHLRDQSLASGTTAMQAGHVGLCPGLVDENQPRRRNQALPLAPLAPPAGDISALLLAGVQGFF